MLDKQDSLLHHYSTNELDNLYLNLLSAISENPDKLEIIQLKKDLGEKYKFFKSLPHTLIVLGSKSSGKKSFAFNIINSLRNESSELSPDIDFFFIREKEKFKNVLIVYENSENSNIQVLRKKDQEIIYCDEVGRLEELRTNLSKGDLIHDFDEILIKLPYFPFPLQILCSPSFNEQTVSLIDNHLVNTSIPIFLHVCSFDCEVKSTDKQFDYLKFLFNKYSHSYFYLVMTKIDTVDIKLKPSSGEQKMKHYVQSFLKCLEKVELKYVGLTVINNLEADKGIYREIFKFLTDFHRENISILKMDYFKCLLRSSINKFSLASSKKKNSSMEATNITNFKEELEEQLDSRLSELLTNLPKTKKEIKNHYRKWYDTFKEVMKKNDSKVLMNKKYMNRMSFMEDHYELIKPHFDTFLKEVTCKVMMEVYPNIQFNQYMNELHTESLFILSSSYQVGSYVGIWSKEGVYSEIIEKLFERLKANKSVLIHSCKEIFQRALDQNMTYLEFISKSGDLVKHLYKLIELQTVRSREIEVATAKMLLVQYCNKRQDEVSKVIIKTLES
jgi:hypothetical protein